MSPKIHPSIWSDDDFAALDDAGKVLFFWLITNEATNNIGFLAVSRKALRDDTGKPLEALLSLLKSLPRGFYFEHEKDRLLVWSRHFIRYQWEVGQLQPNSRLFTNLRNLFHALPETFQAVFEATYKPLVSHFKAARGLEVPCKGPEQSRAEQSRASSSSGEGVGGGADVPADAEVIAFAAAYQDLARGMGPIPEGYALDWLAWRHTPKAGPWPRDWRADLARRYTAAVVKGEVDGFQKKTAPKTGGVSPSVETIALQRELDALSEELNRQHASDQPVDPALVRREAELKKRLRELRPGYARDDG